MFVLRFAASEPVAGPMAAAGLVARYETLIADIQANKHTASLLQVEGWQAEQESIKNEAVAAGVYERRVARLDMECLALCCQAAMNAVRRVAR